MQSGASASTTTGELSIVCAACKIEAIQKAMVPPPGSQQLRKQLERLKGEVTQCSLQLAHLHEERDKALVEMFRLEEVAPLVRKEQGANRRMVSLSTSLHCFTVAFSVL